jgi:hypothetical protein
MVLALGEEVGKQEGVMVDCWRGGKEVVWWR